MIVLDTQAWLWWMHDPSKLSKKAIAAIKEAEASEGMLVSAISVWEVAVKNSLGKLDLPIEIFEWYRKASGYPHIIIELISPLDLIASTQLPGDFHKDPADRMIVALARRYGAPLVTSDEKIIDYTHVATIW